jgi:nicotinamidase-related amidase
MNANYVLAQNGVVVFGDLQDGIIDHARSNDPARIAQTAGVLARVARIFSIPIVVTTVPVGSGELAPPLAAALDAPQIYQRSTTSAFDNLAFREAIEATQRRLLLICGVASEIVVQRMALAALGTGYQVQVVVDACGGFGERSEQAAFTRIVEAGGTLTSVPGVIGELAADFTTAGAGEALGILTELGSIS